MCPIDSVTGDRRLRGDFLESGPEKFLPPIPSDNSSVHGALPGYNLAYYFTTGPYYPTLLPYPTGPTALPPYHLILIIMMMMMMMMI